LITTGGEKLWDWEQVAPWLEEHASGRHGSVVLQNCRATSSTARVLATADRVLRARDALRSEPDDQVRRELERLLEDA
jgi:hypothetical protein